MDLSETIEKYNSQSDIIFCHDCILAQRFRKSKEKDKKVFPKELLAAPGTPAQLSRLG
jgi:hypothetical protein